MIASLNGTLISIDSNGCVIECGGVGYYCFISSKTLGHLPDIGQKVSLFTIMSVKEDAIDLFGFYEQSEQQCFKLIVSVSGVGPKIGLALLSSLTPDQINMAIATNDPKTLTVAPGVGLKLAQRMVLELKDKVYAVPGSGEVNVGGAITAEQQNSRKEAIAGLMTLGFTQSEASNAVNSIKEEFSADDYLRNALKLLARKV